MSAAVLTGRSRLRPGVLFAAIAVALVSALAGLLIGPVKLSAAGVVHELAHHIPFLSIDHGLGPTDALILDELRLPRVVLGLMVGGMLGLAGCAYQGVFRNPLADPYLLGSAAGAGFGATCAIALGAHGSLGPVDTLPLAAFAGSLIAVAGTYLLGRSAGEGARRLVLAGVTVGGLLHGAADVRAAALRREPAGDLLVHPRRHRDRELARRRARLALLPGRGDRRAAVRARARRARAGGRGGREPGHQRAARAPVVVVAATIGTAAVVSVSGLIGFVGIIVPHCVRLVLKTAACACCCRCRSCSAGRSSCSATSPRARSMSPAELPIGVITAFLGAPFFAVVLRSARRIA